MKSSGGVDVRKVFCLSNHQFCRRFFHHFVFVQFWRFWLEMCHRSNWIVAAVVVLPGLGPQPGWCSVEILLSTKVTINNFLFWVSQSWSRGAGLSRAVRRLYDLEIIREGATVLAAGATLTSDTFFDVELWREAGDRRKQTGKGDKNGSEPGVAVGSGISGLLLLDAGQHSQDIDEALKR